MNLLQKYNNGVFLILTDLETDDLIAIRILSREISNSKIVFLVGEGDPSIKFSRLKFYAKQWGFKNFKVFPGYPSKKKFKDESSLIPNLQYNNPKKCFNLEPFIKTHNPTIICLKPPRELFDGFLKNNEIFKKCALFIYGGFNIRCLLKKGDIVLFLNCFKVCFYYETHHSIGKQNNITSKDMNMKYLDTDIYKTMIMWNNHLIYDKTKRCEKLKKTIKLDDETKAKIHRSEKILSQIKNDKEQFVNASCGLIISMLQKKNFYKPMKLTFNKGTGYSEIIETDNRNMYIIQPNNKERYREYQKKFLLTFFARKYHKKKLKYLLILIIFVLTIICFLIL